jgi:hypothetical protein
MTFEEFQKTLSASTPPGDFSHYLQALWYDAKGNWNKAHSVIQNIEDLPASLRRPKPLATARRHGKTAAWIHAYLHRQGR